MAIVKQKYGFLPTSIWRMIKDPDLCALIKDDKPERYDHGRPFKDGVIPLSEFMPDTAIRCYKYWGMEGDKILDPFAGRVTRAVVANKLNRHYIGYDVSPSTVKHDSDRLDELLRKGVINDKYICEIREGDSSVCLSNFDDFTPDMIFTCPPYWKVEEYEHVTGQMNDIKTYYQFMRKYTDVLRDCYKLLKFGRFCVYVVGDFRRDKVFYDFSGDTVTAAKEARFHYHDIVINELFTPFIHGMSTFEKSKITAKTHEYVLVFRKGKTIDKTLMDACMAMSDGNKSLDRFE